MAKTRFITVELGNYTILHGFNDTNTEIKEYKKVDKAQTVLLATDSILSVDEKHITTKYLKDRICIWEYHNNFEEIQSELSKKTMRPY